MRASDVDQLARARLAFVSAGRPSLGEPRHANHEARADDHPQLAAGPMDQDEPPPPIPPVVDGPVGPRRITLKHMAVLALLMLCGVGVAVAALSRSSATEVPVTIATPSAPASSVAAASSSASPTTPAQIRVHVLGAVRKPGVVRLPTGAIVQDAVRAAGGLSAGADPAQLNLAAQVADGMQIIIGTRGRPRGEIKGQPQSPVPKGGDGRAQTSSALDLNSATQAQLEQLPGVGPVTAKAILAWREEHGRFSNVGELQEVTGIGPKTLEKLKPLVRV